MSNLAFVVALIAAASYFRKFQDSVGPVQAARIALHVATLNKTTPYNLY